MMGSGVNADTKCVRRHLLDDAASDVPAWRKRPASRGTGFCLAPVCKWQALRGPGRAGHYVRASAGCSHRVGRATPGATAGVHGRWGLSSGGHLRSGQPSRGRAPLGDGGRVHVYTWAACCADPGRPRAVRQRVAARFGPFLRQIIVNALLKWCVTA